MHRSIWTWVLLIVLDVAAPGARTDVALRRDPNRQKRRSSRRGNRDSIGRGQRSLAQKAGGRHHSIDAGARSRATKNLLSETLGPEVAIDFRPAKMVVTIDEMILTPERREEWLRRLRNLSDRAGEAARHRQAYGMHALNSYRANEPSRPTICLIHGLNSSSGGFVHMIPWLEEAGYGIVVYDYPFNRNIAESCQVFARDWSAFRGEVKDKLPWSIVAHSMGALLARSLVEDEAGPISDVRSLILIAPVNHGSNLAKMQTMVQLMNGLQAMNGKDTTKAMMNLSDGLGQAAQDMLPGSVFLKKLNQRPRRSGLPLHIIAGDRGFLTRESRAQIEGRIDLLKEQFRYLRSTDADCHRRPTRSARRTD